MFIHLVLDQAFNENHISFIDGGCHLPPQPNTLGIHDWINLLLFLLVKYKPYINQETHWLITTKECLIQRYYIILASIFPYIPDTISCEGTRTNPIHRHQSLWRSLPACCARPPVFWSSHYVRIWPPPHLGNRNSTPSNWSACAYSKSILLFLLLFRQS
jgi:hypothetical protein